MMIVPLLVRGISAIVVGTLAGSSARNMLQTYNICQQVEHESSFLIKHNFDNSNNNNSKTKTCDDTTNEHLMTIQQKLQQHKYVNGVVKELQGMNRKELLRLFLESSTSPLSSAEESEDEESLMSLIEGEWDGCLLDNNGWIMTFVSSLLTNVLFSIGRDGKWNGRWDGKRFNDNGIGTNRFFSSGEARYETLVFEENNEHEFDYSISTSNILGCNTKSIILKYSPYQKFYSLWKTMLDEVRFVPLLNNNNAKDNNGFDVLIGMGSIGWSGGMLNCQPFCLYRCRRAEQARKDAIARIEEEKDNTKF